MESLRTLANEEIFAESEEEATAGSEPARIGEDRRAYYRVSGLLPIRVTPIQEDQVEAAIFDLSMPDPLLAPLDGEDEDAPLTARLRRIEEKLDLLLGAAQIEAPKNLAGRDRRSVVFSGSGLCLDWQGSFRKGDAFRVEILLPPPYSRPVRAIARCVHDASPEVPDSEEQAMALALDHMEPDERDALIAYSYDLQRFALRARQSPASGEGE